MPSLIRFLVFCGVVAGLVYGGMFALVMYVKPREREISVRVPPEKLNPQPPEATIPTAQPMQVPNTPDAAAPAASDGTAPKETMGETTGEPMGETTGATEAGTGIAPDRPIEPPSQPE